MPNPSRLVNKTSCEPTPICRTPIWTPPATAPGRHDSPWPPAKQPQAEQVRRSALTTNEVAALLGRAPAHVRRSHLRGDLYAIKDGRANLFPRWQFTPDGTPINGLRRIIGVFPDDFHPLDIAAVMTTARRSPRRQVPGRLAVRGRPGRAGARPHRRLELHVIRPKNPRTPPGPLTVEPGEIVDFDGALWRIHRTTGAHPSAWDALRTYGPLPAMRWDPHPPPVADHPGCGVSYAATTPRTTFYEVFQDRRAITLTDSQSISAWTPARTLRLLDLTDSHWLVRHGASASLPHTRKDTCRSWAHEIWEQLGTRIDGLLTPSTVNGAATCRPVRYCRDQFSARPRIHCAADPLAGADLGSRCLTRHRLAHQIAPSGRPGHPVQ
jgi:hypothetical protein